MFRDNWVLHGFSDSGQHYIDYSGSAPHPRLTSPLDIAMEECWHIHEALGEVTVLLSGGVDSQATAFAYKMSGAPCRFLQFSFTGGFNRHDLVGGEAFYKEHSVEVETMELDVVGFHETQLVDWAKRFKCSSPHMLTHMKMASLAHGPVVFGGTPVSRDRKIGGMEYNTFGLERYGDISGQPTVGYFLIYSRYLHWAFDSISLHQTKDFYERKCHLYWDSGFPVIPQENKLHGFEKLKEYYDDHPVASSERIKYRTYPSKRPYDLLFRYPLLPYASR